jgi:hypothetical protein
MMPRLPVAKKRPQTKASAFVSGPTNKNSPESQLDSPDPNSNTKSMTTTRMAKVRPKVKRNGQPPEKGDAESSVSSCFFSLWELSTSFDTIFSVRCLDKALRISG